MSLEKQKEIHMSGECYKCGEHALECKCVLHAFEIPKPNSIARLEHNAKYLENQQRLKNLADLDKSVTPPSDE